MLKYLLFNMLASVFVTQLYGDPIKPPNIVLIIADDLGIGDIGCFGNDTIRTPNIDGIAEQGVKLTHHLTAESTCTPSRAALMTGRYPVRLGMASDTNIPMLLWTACTGGLPSEETTIAEVAKQKGYSTALIGKWHLGVNCRWFGDNCHHPLNQGFDYFFGAPLTNIKDFGEDPEDTAIKFSNPTFVFKIRLIVTCGILFMVLLFWTKYLTKFNFVTVIVLYALVPCYWYVSMSYLKTLNSSLMRNFDYVEQPIRFDNMSQRLVDEGVRFLEEQQRNSQPFLLVMSWLQVHTYLHTGPRFTGVSQHGKFGDNIEEMDWSTGEILRALERLGMKENTLVYFTSDNGPHVEERNPRGDREGGWPGKYKGGKFQGGTDGGIRVPTVMMWPGHIPANIEIPAPTSQMDLFPTIRNLLDVAPEAKTMDGKDVTALLQGKTTKSPHKFLWHYCSKSLHSARYIPDDGEDIWKVYYVTHKYWPGTQRCGFVCSCYDNVITLDPPLLFNLGTDPYEDHPIDISSDAKYTDIINDIATARAQHEASIGRVTNKLGFPEQLWMPHLQTCCNFPTCNCTDPERHKV